LRHLKEEIGLTDQEMSSNYWALRSAKGSKMVMNSLRWEEAQRRARQAMPEVNKPLRPGHSNGSFAPTNLSTIAESGNMAEFIRARSKGRVR
jgi:hypothetical protein